MDLNHAIFCHSLQPAQLPAHVFGVETDDHVVVCWGFLALTLIGFIETGTGWFVAYTGLVVLGLFLIDFDGAEGYGLRR
ncbi:MAG: hypothetical protein RLZZ129_1113 [Verrucomicrobiota bacterium]